jgi:hypothetical protein
MQVLPLAMSTLKEILVHTQQRFSHATQFLSRRGFLQHFLAVFNIVDAGGDISARMYQYSSTVSLLTCVAQTREGAEELLSYGAVQQLIKSTLLLQVRLQYHPPCLAYTTTLPV